MADDIAPIPPAEPERDPELTALLRAHVDGAQGAPQPDWPAFHGRLMARARERLGERLAAHTPPSWWSYAAHWARPAIPAGLAASLLLGLGVAFFGNGANGSAAAAEPAAIEDVLASAATDALPVDMLMAGDETLLAPVLEPSR